MAQAIDSLHADLQGLLGQTIGERYRVDGLLGAGGMGAVFRGFHLGLRREVAIKVLHPEIGQDPQISRRFDREAHSSSRLDHPNCVRVTDFGSTPDGVKYLVMDFLRGKELTSYLGRPLPPHDAIDDLLQVFRALDHAHRQGVVHRDLKPENIFVTEDGAGNRVLKLVDFGIAKIVSGVDGSDNLTRAGLVFGTPQYMSPEQAAGGTVDHRTDLYSAGIILYEALTGDVPFRNDDVVTLLRLQVTAKPPPLPGTVPSELAAIVNGLLAKSADQRYASAKEVVEKLSSLRHALAEAHGSEVIHVASPLHGRGLTPETASPSPQQVSSLELSSARTALQVANRHGFRSRPEVVRAFTDAGRWIVQHRRERAVVGTSAAMLAVVLTCGVWALGDWGPSEADTREVQRLILADKPQEALGLLKPLLDRYPDDARLLWQHGRILAKRGKKAAALRAYEKALDQDASMLEDREFYAELSTLLDEPTLRDEAVSLALRAMGEHGHQFLVEQVNREQNALPLQTRHRILEQVRENEETARLIDEKLNNVLDLRQAGQSPTPCSSFANALDRIESDPDPSYLEPVHRAKVPRPKRPGDEDDAEVCKGLDDRLREVREELERRYGAPKQERAPDSVAGDGARGSKRDDSGENGSSDSSEDGDAKKKKSRRCRGFGRIFRKGCR